MKFSLDRILKSRAQSAPAAAPAAHIAYDAASMIIDGKRTIIRGGSFHYYRLPSSDLWKDRLLKIKRAGYNAVDLYFYWGYHSSANGVYDFSGVRDVDRLLALCDELGLYVIARPGPFINSEVDGGGHPAWVLADERAALRCLDGGQHVDSPVYLEYVRQWYEQITPRIVRCQNLLLFQIENEYSNDTLNPAYMQFLRDLARQLGVTVPLIHNDLWKKGCWADLVDIYGVDDYAVTSFKNDWRDQPGLMGGMEKLAEIKAKYCTKSPLAIFELQGGWFDPWNGRGYDAVRSRLGAENMNLVTWTALAHGTGIYNHYMFAGGTNWDHVGAPPAHTSYDFAAPITEWGGLPERYMAAKSIAHVVGAFEDVFARSEPSNDVQASDPALLYAARRSGDAYIVFLRNLSAQTRSTTLTAGGAHCDAVSVLPWDMRVAFLNLPFVDAYLTTNCSIFTTMHNDNQHQIVFCGAGTVRWTLPSACRVLRDDLSAQVEGTRVTVSYDGEGWKDVVFSSGGHRYRALFLPNADEAWRISDFLVVGASYVGEGRRKGGVTDLPRYEMRVQTAGAKEKQIRIYSLSYMARLEINDEMILASSDSIAGYMRCEMPRPPQVVLPTLGPWRVLPALEARVMHPATGWRAIPPDQSLEMDKLGIYQGMACYRATYTGKMSRIGLAIRHNAALYLNGSFAAKLDNYQSEADDDSPESATVAPVNVSLPAAMQTDGENVLLVVVESLGHNKGFLGNERLPRGILAVQADHALTWSVRAGVVGEADAPTAAFDDSGWAQAGDLAALPDADLLWARTSFTLDMPKDAFAPVGLHIEGVADKAHIYLNGVLIARDWSICQHRTFYLPDGVLNTHGDNTLALLLWRRGGKPAVGTVELRAFTVEANNFVNVL
jgi:beta-galactosidase